MGTDAASTAGRATRPAGRWLRAAAASVFVLALLCAASGQARAAAGTGSPPVNTALPVISGTAQPGQTLACSPGTWNPAGDVYTYAWSRDGAPILGAVTASYTVGSADVGHSLTCSVTAVNIDGTSAATSAPVVAGATPSGGGGGTGGGTGTASPLPKVTEVVDMPGKRRCGSRRRFRIRIRNVTGLSIASVAVFVNGRRVKVLAGTRLTAPVDLRSLPKGRFAAKIVVTASDGRKISHTRRYRTCSSKRGGKRRHRL